jgi:hypothetical protein
MRIPKELLDAVVFLGSLQGAAQFVPEGTGFLVHLPIPDIPHLKFNYLVTARHVYEKLEPNIHIRVNQTNGGALEIAADGTHWFFHPQHGKGNYIDVAVMEWPSLDGFDVRFLSDATIFGKRGGLQDEHKIGLGDELFAVGLFASAVGLRRSMPIVRHGTMAMLPEDRVETARHGHIEAYLAEIRSFGGLSGSPVFARATVSLNAGKGNPRMDVHGPTGLLGLMHGHWHVAEGDVNANEFHGPVNAPGVNLGIALVIPAYLIMETLNHPELLARREASAAQARASRSRT